MTRRLLLMCGGLLLWAAVAFAQRAGIPVQTSWNYDLPLQPGVVVTAFQLQRCEAVCTSTCTPQDVSGATVGPTLRTITDSAVYGGVSYWYQLVAVGTINSQDSRSLASGMVCMYVKAAQRGGPSTTPDTP